VVVYSNRANLLQTLERSYAVTFNHGISSVDVAWNPGAGQEKPAVRPGTWVLDATVTRGANAPEPYGFFYRVTGVSDTGANTINIELETPIKTSFPQWGQYPNPVG